ncbi:ATP-dependent Clp protease ATP-binding subunit ClpC [Vulcanimicrobium alpinum]|uniref:ATP-dependent Clp protease ATP-binding subunit ClpC n=2 Tax=Vulcanimicrobium alpinum TaxID=3016050 RepID=A0AAN2C9J5_UNVUL|nr:ATP-dependent Clp protease ATP-binding subunit ClpC [Vulcanimicrobium alpinum]
MWEPFTERARRSIVLAQEEAQRLGNNYIGTEHILLGIISEGESLAAKVLETLGVNLAKVRQEVEAIVGRGGQTVQQEMVFTPRAKRVIELAFEEARQLNHNYIGTEHLLLGLIREGEGVAARVLTNLGVDPAKVRVQTTSLLGAEGQPPAPKGKSKTPTLDAYGRDLTQLARENKLDPVIGRANEIERVIQILSRRTKNNPALIGEPGVGKTAIAEGLAQRVIKTEVPEPLRDKRVITLDLAGLVAGTKYRGEFEERMKRVMDEIRGASGEIILFIDELHTLVGAGAAEGAIDASNIIKPALARGELQCIGATTLNEFRKHIEKDSALERRFQPVMVGEPSVDETVEILKGLRDRYEAHHKVTITDEALVAAAKLGDRYISDRFLPDKAVDLIDEAASRVRLQATLPPPAIREVENEIRKVKQEKESVVKSQEFEKAAAIRDREEKLRLEKQRLENEWAEARAKQDKTIKVTEEDVAHIVSSWTKIPVSKLAQAETAKLLGMEEQLHKRVIGQNQAVSTVTRAIRRSRAGLKNPKRPIGSFIFLGPTGVGKTEVARSLAEFMFDDSESMIRIDMSEYMEKYAVSRLVGAPPGYVGYEEGGQLTEAVRRRPYSVVLLDEIEKAHPDVFNLLLQVLEDGRLTDSQGRVVDFKNTVIIMTSNVGATGMTTSSEIGFRPTRGSESNEDQAYERMKNKVLDEVKHAFRPEFLNRVDEIVVFHSLNREQIAEIVGLELEKVIREVKAQDMHLEVTDDAKQLLAKKGWDPQFGARPLRRAIQREVEDELAEEMLKGNFSTGDRILAEVSQDNPEKLRFSKIPRIEPPAPSTPEVQPV